MRTFGVVFLSKAIESGLLRAAHWRHSMQLQRIRLQREVQALMATILFRMRRSDPFRPDPQAQPPDR